MHQLKRHQRGYAAIPYIVSFFTASGTAGATAAAGSAAATTGAAAAGTAVAAGGASAAGLAAAGAAGAAAYTGLAAYGASKLIGQPKAPVIPGVPTIDQAAQQRQTQDRLLARRGVLANIYGGNRTGGAPTVGTARLLGG